MYRILAILLLPFALNGCAAVLVGGLVYHDSKSREQRAAFNEHFNQMNLERGKAGLPPLDYCTEARHSDQTWANDLPECKATAAKAAPAEQPASAAKSDAAGGATTTDKS
jgi:hypothetical protein